jgi:hypothetical protein
MRRYKAIRSLTVAALMIVAASCAKPARISTTLDVTRRSPDVVLVMLRVVNLEDRPTTPIAPVVSVQTRSADGWDKATDAIHPAAFVLNKKEQRDIFKVLHTSANLVRATVTVREQESGHVLVNQRIEKALATVPQQAPATPVPATPQRPDR